MQKANSFIYLIFYSFAICYFSSCIWREFSANGWKEETFDFGFSADHNLYYLALQEHHWQRSHTRFPCCVFSGEVAVYVLWFGSQIVPFEIRLFCVEFLASSSFAALVSLRSVCPGCFSLMCPAKDASRPRFLFVKGFSLEKPSGHWASLWNRTVQASINIVLCFLKWANASDKYFSSNCNKVFRYNLSSLKTLSCHDIFH